MELTDSIVSGFAGNKLLFPMHDNRDCPSPNLYIWKTAENNVGRYLEVGTKFVKVACESNPTAMVIKVYKYVHSDSNSFPIVLNFHVVRKGNPRLAVFYQPMTALFAYTTSYGVVIPYSELTLSGISLPNHSSITLYTPADIAKLKAMERLCNRNGIQLRDYHSGTSAQGCSEDDQGGAFVHLFDASTRDLPRVPMQSPPYEGHERALLTREALRVSWQGVVQREADDEKAIRSSLYSHRECHHETMKERWPSSAKQERGGLIRIDSLHLPAAALRLDDWAPDDGNGVCVYPDDPMISPVGIINTLAHHDVLPLPKFEPLCSLAGRDIEDLQKILKTFPIQRKKRASRSAASLQYAGSSVCSCKILVGTAGVKLAVPAGAHKVKSCIHLERFHTARTAASRVIGADSAIHERAEKMRGYTGPLYGGNVPERGLVEIEMGDGASVSVFDSEGI
ncbi:hypothetical protein DFH09DRAFT_1079592 [Mycena vulgaris]|nr:hypothetical protein DFH09DRAFT_1079592 [Mycena vulgaris]